MERMFRLLNADEIECRISQVKENGVQLLFYKDARCDMNILDETVGAMNWQRSHTRDNANCIVSIWDAEKKLWISKEDTGTESNTEAAKGLASDSFKRACFNFGIGRELYTAPFTWIPKDKCNISQSGNKFVCYDRFKVSQIGYDDKGNINLVIVINEKTKAVVFEFGNTKAITSKTKKAITNADFVRPEEDIKAEKVKPSDVAVIRKHIERTGIGEKYILANYKVSDLSELSFEQWKDCVDKLAKKPDKKVS